MAGSTPGSQSPAHSTDRSGDRRVLSKGLGSGETFLAERLGGPRSSCGSEITRHSAAHRPSVTAGGKPSWLAAETVTGKEYPTQAAVLPTPSAVPSPVGTELEAAERVATGVCPGKFPNLGSTAASCSGKRPRM